MPDTEPLIRNISDTARWVAAYRALETSRPDALFRDPLAACLAGDRGRAVAECTRHDSWPFTIRTIEFDAEIKRFVSNGVDTIVNLAAGLDTRPYRMSLPASLRWIEMDLPEILAEKEQLLAGEKPACKLKRIPVDLTDAAARRAAFAAVGPTTQSALVLCEGLLIYLTEANVVSLAEDIAAVQSFRHWAVDIVTPPLFKILKRSLERNLKHVGDAMLFAPAAGPAFFEAHGWRVTSARSLLKTAARHKRVNLFMRLIALFPDTQGKPSRQPWGGICVLEQCKIEESSS